MDASILTDVLSSLVNATSTGFDGLRAQAEGLFYKLLLIEFVLFGIGVALNRIDVQRELVAKVIAIGFVQFLLFRYVWLVDGMRDGFVSIGIDAAGGNLSISEFLDPSAFVRMGFSKVFAIIVSRFDESGLWAFLPTASLIWLLHAFALLLMFFAFVAVGLQIFLAVAEFYIVSTLAIILIPFLLLTKTSFLGFRALNGLISICIKLMVIAFIASLSVPVIELLTLTDNDPTVRDSMCLAVGALAISLLMWRAPSMAMSLISGSGGMDAASTFLSPALQGASAAKSAAGAMGNAAAGGAKALGDVAIATYTGYKNGK